MNATAEATLAPSPRDPDLSGRDEQPEGLYLFSKRGAATAALLHGFP
ncbi:hypothetical protein [Rhizobium sp. Root1203]|nr:hypothetical protein [Rhizobium sp. Root1203]